MVVLPNHKALCTTDLTDYTDVQAIGSDDMYNRYESVFSVIQRCIDKKYWSFLAQPIYSNTEEKITWYTAEWHETPQNLCDLDEWSRQRYEIIKNETINHYKSVLPKLDVDDRKILSNALTYIYDEFIFCFDDKVVLVAWGMRPQKSTISPSGLLTYIGAKKRHSITFDCGELGSFENKYQAQTLREENYQLTLADCPKIIPKSGYRHTGWLPNPVGCAVLQEMHFVAQYEELPPMCHVRFIDDGHCQISGHCEFDIPSGTQLSSNQIPTVTPDPGYEFLYWDLDTNMPINEDTSFTAVCGPAKQDFNIRFDAGEHGSIKGMDFLTLSNGQWMTDSDIPQVKAKCGYKFTGWDVDPLSCTIDEDKVFTAQYKERWWKSIWHKRWFRWLMWLLLLLLLTLLFCWLFRNCSSRHQNTVKHKKVPKTTHVAPITKVNPGGTVVPPIVWDNGSGSVPIIENPGAPSVVSNRLNLYFEEDDADLNQFIQEFKKIYSSKEYNIIGYDDKVKWIQIEIPEAERNKVRNEITEKIPSQPFFVVDESIFEINGSYKTSASDAGWHLNAINADAGWKITRGSPDIIVAVVDDGCDINHPMLKGKITGAYNIFSQSSSLSTGNGHGTATASVAAGNGEKRSAGLSGIAPNCKIMPIQVFDHEMCTFSSLVNGIMYAIHQGANVVNISVASSFPGLDIFSPEEQNAIANDRFHNEERAWKKVFNVANKKNTILVFAAGNDNILACVPPEHRSNSIVCVAAVDKQCKRAIKFTNYSNGHSISAPGVDVYCAANGGKYNYLDGTSFSAPIVSGTIALMLSLNPNLTVDNVIAIMQKSGKYVGDDICPMVQLDKALTMVKKGEIPERQYNNFDPGKPSNGSGGNGSNIGGGNGSNIGGGNGSNNGGGNGSNIGGGNGSNIGGGNGTDDYDYIRRLIKEYEQRIIELKNRLPENQNR